MVQDSPATELPVAHAEGRLARRLRSYLLDEDRRPMIIAAAVFGIYGFAHFDFADFSALTADPFSVLPDPRRQFLHAYPLIFFIGWPITRLFGHNLAYLAVTLGGLTFLLWAFRFYLRGWPTKRRNPIAIALLASPLLLVILFWIGKSDPFVLALFLVYSRLRQGTFWPFVLSLLMVLGHREIGTLILVGDAVLRWRATPALVAGVVTGHALVHLYIAHLSGPIVTVVGLSLASFAPVVTGWITNLLAHLALGFGWFWILIFRRRLDSDRLRVGAVILLCFAAAFTTADFTRVFLLCASPVLLYTAEKVATSAKDSALVSRASFAILCLVQAQLINFDELRDSTWPGYVVNNLRKLGGV